MVPNRTKSNASYLLQVAGACRPACPKTYCAETKHGLLKKFRSAYFVSNIGILKGPVVCGFELME
jgi:hypothetical protein